MRHIAKFLIIIIMLPGIVTGIIAGGIAGSFLAGIRLWNIAVDLVDKKL